MKTMSSTDRSRIVATAKSLGAFAPDSHCFTDKQVLLTADPQTLNTVNGQDCFLNAFRLLVRMVEKLTVHLPADSACLPLLQSERARISFDRPPEICSDTNCDLGKFDAILAVGCNAHRHLPWTTVNSNGWVARVSSRGQPLPSEVGQPNPIGALGAACLGVAEVFKRLISLRPERGELLPASSFSFFSYCECDDPGPPLPNDIPLDVLLVGIGAIGNGIVHLLNRLPVSGQLGVLDYQKIGSDNWGTYLLVGPDDFDLPKVLWAENMLGSKLAIAAHNFKIEHFNDKCGKSFPFPRIIINALDNIPARHFTQLLWPDLIIDGAIGPTACEVTLHPWPSNLSCLLCDFDEPLTPALQLQLAATGLRAARIAQPNSTITEDDIAAAPAARRNWLQSQIGKPVCSVISDAVLATLSAEEHQKGFAPSAPFVACLSACMVTTELVRHVCKWPKALETGFQFDSLIGPANGVLKTHSRKGTCMCVTRKANIELFRGLR